ncbi:MAG TPA: hypothetical protein ENJ41_09045 [Oceanospirillales bacterium]|nr:hypothetical protein [Oceanospirillales bacterium]
MEGQNKKYHYITSNNKALAGIYKINKNSQLSASIITCPSHPSFESIHKKSMPLMLDMNDQALIASWLDPHMQESEAFSYLLNNKITQALSVTAIMAARNLTPIADSYIFAVD